MLWSISAIENAYSITAALPTLALLILFAGCSGESAVTIAKINQKIDYSLSQSWTAMPGTQNSASAIPVGSGLSSLEESAKIDVFYIHPLTRDKSKEQGSNQAEAPAYT